MKKIGVLFSLIIALMFNSVNLNHINQEAVNKLIISKHSKIVAIDDPITPKAHKHKPIIQV